MRDMLVLATRYCTQKQPETTTPLTIAGTDGAVPFAAVGDPVASSPVIVPPTRQQRQQLPSQLMSIPVGGTRAAADTSLSISHS